MVVWKAGRALGRVVMGPHIGNKRGGVDRIHATCQNDNCPEMGEELEQPQITHLQNTTRGVLPPPGFLFAFLIMLVSGA